MKNTDTLKYLQENFIRVIRHEECLHYELTEAQKRDHIVQRNEFLNECISVIKKELNIHFINPVRFLKLDVRKEIREIYILIKKLQAAEEKTKNAKCI